MRRVHFKDDTYKDVEDKQVWEYENDPEWKETENLTENKCEDGTKQPDGGCYGCPEGSLCE